MSENVHGEFISHKVSKIRWKPEELEDAEYFVTGSYDEVINFLTLWYYPLKETDSENYPLKERVLTHHGDITEIRFLLKNKLVVSSSFGSVKLIQSSHNGSADLSELTSWEGLHYFKNGDASSCTGLACFEEDIATVGEDGRITLITVSQTKPVRTIENADSCPLRCICFLKHNELLTGNLRGQMKIWDLRVNEDVPLSTFMISGDHISTTCVTHHPTQNHLMLAGGEDGSISVWDLRKSTHPVNVLNAHKNSVCEIAFHQEQPDHLFSCSFSGELWHWNTNRNIRDYIGEENSWLSSDATKHRMEIFSLMPTICKPINSLDINRTRLICGCDNEAIYIVSNLPL